MTSQEYMEQLFAQTPPEELRFTRYSMDIIERIHDILDEKGIKTQKEFAELMGKKESEISKWLSIDHNLTIKTLAKIEIALDEILICSPKRAEKETMYKPMANLKMSLGKKQNKCSDTKIRKLVDKDSEHKLFA